MAELSNSVSKLEDHDTLTRLVVTVEAGFNNLNEKFDNFKDEVKDEISQINSRCPSKLCQVHSDELTKTKEDVNKLTIENEKLKSDIDSLKQAKIRQWEAILVFVPLTVGIFTWAIEILL